MTSVFDDATVDLPCPNCGHKINERISNLKLSPTIPCPNCGANIKVDANQLNAGINEADKAVDDLRRTLRNLGKK